MLRREILLLIKIYKVSNEERWELLKSILIKLLEDLNDKRPLDLFEEESFANVASKVLSINNKLKRR